MNYSETLILGLGANRAGPIGPPEATLQWATEQLREFFGPMTVSPVFYTAPQHRSDQPWYYNQVVAGTTDRGPRRVLRILNHLESVAGRDRSHEVRFGSRTLDLDILMYGNLQVSSTDLVIPHPRMHQRAFVLEPLFHIVPDARDPRSGRLWSSYR